MSCLDMDQERKMGIGSADAEHQAQEFGQKIPLGFGLQQ